MSADPALQHEVEQFLFHEARLLDLCGFEDWLNLFAEDGIYWIPSEPQQTDPIETVSIIYEDLSLMRMRVQRLVHPRAHALEPAPRTLHTVGNVEAEFFEPWKWKPHYSNPAFNRVTTNRRRRCP